MNDKLKKHLFLVLRFVVSFGLIGYIFYQISHRQDLKLADLAVYYSNANYLWLAGAVLLLLLLLAAGSLRWGLLLKAQGVKLKPTSVFMYFMIGFFFNNFLPSTVGGDVVKTYYLAKFTGRGAESFVSVIMDRIMGMSGLCVVALVSLLCGGKNLWDNPETHPYALPIFLIVGGLSVGLVLFFLVIFNDKVMVFFLKVARWGKFGEKIKKLHQSLYVYKGKWSVLVQTLLISTGLWVVIVLFCWIIYQAFSRTIPHIPIGYFYLFLPTISVIMSLPISVAGLGTRELAFVTFFTKVPNVNVTALDALVISLNFYFVFLVASLVGGIIYVLKDQLHFHREEIVEVEESVNY